MSSEKQLNLPEHLLKNSKSTNFQKIQQTAIQALQNSEFDLAFKAMEQGHISLPKLIEDLQIYQAELEIQNDELRQSQSLSDNAMRRYSSLFDNLPMPAMMIDQIGIVYECNEQATQKFNLPRTNLGSYFFPRLVKKQDHGRLHHLLENAKNIGQAIMCDVAMQAVNTSYTVDIHATLLPDFDADRPHFVVTIIDQTQSTEQLKEIQTIYMISRATQQMNDIDTFIARVLRLIPKGMRYPKDTRVSITLGDKISGNVNTDEMLASTSSTIESNGMTFGKLVVAYTADSTPKCNPSCHAAFGKDSAKKTE